MKSCNLPFFFINHENQNRNNTNKTVISSVSHIHTKNSAPIFFWSVETVIVDGLKICPSSSNKWTEVTNLDTDISSRLKGRVQVRKRVLVKRIIHHHFCSHTDEVCANCFGDEWEGARSAQIAFNHLLERNARRQH